MRKQWNQNRPSFTLVELMVVIVIIGLLATFITQAVVSAMVTAREATIKFEISNLAKALHSYKAKYGEFPPDHSNATVVASHVRHRWPRLTATQVNAFTSGANANLSREQALVFWLRGFSGNPVDPLNVAGGTRESLFDFDKSRLVDPSTGAPTASTTIVPVYLPQNGARAADGTIRPYAYFDARTYATASNAAGKRVYLSDNANETYAASDSFQILHPGLDGDWGLLSATTASYPSGLNYLKGDRDNITSFSRGSTLDDDVP